MKFGGESFKKEEIKSKNETIENQKSPARRNFLKQLFALGVGAVITETPLNLFAESNEKPPIISRPTWDNHWNEIKKEYSVSLGEKYSVVLNGITREKTADILPYFNENFITGRSASLDSNHKFEDLRNVYRRCVIHHTDSKTAGFDAYTQVRQVRDSEMGGKQKFNDLGYHFLIASNGTIMEGRPTGRIGSNAGQTKESGAYKTKYLPGGVSEIAKAKGNATVYYDKLRSYVRALKMDPDFGTLGIALCGDFDTGAQPSKAQQDSLVKILNWIKNEYDIPTNNIIYHREVKKRVIEDSGLTFDGNYKETVCPGRTFPDISNFKSKLKPDTQKAKSKTILLDKFV